MQQSPDGRPTENCTDANNEQNKESDLTTFTMGGMLYDIIPKADNKD